MAATILIRPPARPSDGARTLRQALGQRALLSRLQNRRRIPRQYKYVINWGNASGPVPRTRNTAAVILNKPQAITNAVDKIKAFELLSNGGVRVPTFWTNKEAVDRSGVVLARTNTRGHGGDGIVVCRSSDVLVDAPLYVRYVPKTEEYRVHVVNGRAIFVQQKRKERAQEQTADQKLIRNRSNGWVYCLVDLDGFNPQAIDECVRAVAALGLDFGAVDCIIGRDDSLPHVLEINTAPGLHSPTLVQAYKEAFLNDFGYPVD